MRIKSFFTAEMHERRTDQIVTHAIWEMLVKKIPDHKHAFNHVKIQSDFGRDDNINKDTKKVEDYEYPILVCNWSFKDNFRNEDNSIKEEYDRHMAYGVRNLNDNMKLVYANEKYNTIYMSIDRRMTVTVNVQAAAASISDVRKLHNLITMNIPKGLNDYRIFNVDDVLPENISIYIAAQFTNGASYKPIENMQEFYNTINNEFKNDDNWRFDIIDQNSKGVYDFRVIRSNDVRVVTKMVEEPTPELMKEDKIIRAAKDNFTFEIEFEIPFLYAIDTPKLTNGYSMIEAYLNSKENVRDSKMIIDKIEYSDFESDTKAIDSPLRLRVIDMDNYSYYTREEDINIDKSGDSIDIIEWYPNIAKSLQDVPEIKRKDTFKVLLYNNCARLTEDEDYTITDDLKITFSEITNDERYNHISIFIYINNAIRNKYLYKYVSICDEIDYNVINDDGAKILIYDICPKVSEIQDKVSGKYYNEIIKVEIKSDNGSYLIPKKHYISTDKSLTIYKNIYQVSTYDIHIRFYIIREALYNLDITL